MGLNRLEIAVINNLIRQGLPLPAPGRKESGKRWQCQQDSFANNELDDFEIHLKVDHLEFMVGMKGIACVLDSG